MPPLTLTNSDSSWFVNFYSPRCSHCHHSAPTWKEVAKLLDGVVKIASFNCEYDRHFCHQVGVRAYPTQLYYKKNSQHGIRYTGENTQVAIMRFALDRLDIYVPKISDVQWKRFLRGKDIVERPMLIFTCGDHQNCFSPDDRLVVAATFDKLIDVKVFTCADGNCHDNVSRNTHAVYLPIYNASSWEPVFFDGLSDVNALVEKLLDHLPAPRELTDNDFTIIKGTEADVAWLICFYLGDSAAIDLQMRKLSISGVNLGKIHCGRNGQLCSTLGVNRYPIWGMLKPGGAFELDHGKSSNNDIIKFAQLSVKTTNVQALTLEEAVSILHRHNGDEVWFLDWYTPWCPPCIQFLMELRRASLEFDASIVRFGTIDCTVHTALCRQHSIQYYPTAMLVNGSSTHLFTIQKTAANVIQFINEKRNPSVIELTSESFRRKLARKKSKVMWIVDYFVSWCGPCQRLAPEWVAVAKALSSLPFVNVASVDCEAEASLCSFQGVHSYPNIRMYPLGSEGLSTVALYNGQRDSWSMLTWITSFLPKRIRDLTASDYQRVLDSKHTWIVDFYLPHCWPCQKMEPELAIASHLVEKVKFGRINCNFYVNECAHVKVFPTLVLYDPKRTRKNDGVKIDATTAAAIRDKVLQITNPRLEHDEL
ncbi:DnaJ-like protein subfamily C member [Ooceraea biroi]|uniref:DnaJ-like protein subfamily C member n=1 Tax=Ooceraea biroi TaxID=2015173 RepID=A0A026WSP4_OOCBI|nr:DnaJ-like protein subfamily C member [Ooceraea biroi]